MKKVKFYGMRQELMKRIKKYFLPRKLLLFYFLTWNNMTFHDELYFVFTMIQENFSLISLIAICFLCSDSFCQSGRVWSLVQFEDRYVMMCDLSYNMWGITYCHPYSYKIKCKISPMLTLKTCYLTILAVKLWQVWRISLPLETIVGWGKCGI